MSAVGAVPLLASAEEHPLVDDDDDVFEDGDLEVC